MASTATTSLRLEKQGTGDNSNTWGARLNTNSLDLIDTAIAGRTTFTLSGLKTLTSTNYAADEARAIFLDITSGTGGTVTIPSVAKTYIVRNATSGNVIITTGGGTTATFPTGVVGWCVCDATNVYLDQALNFGASLPFTTGTPTLTTHLTTKTYVDSTISSAIGGSLPSTTGTGAVVLQTGPTLSNPIVGTQTQGDNSTKAASTAYVDTAVSGATGWTQIGTTITLSSLTSFAGFPQTYSELYIEVIGATHGDGSNRALRCLLDATTVLTFSAQVAGATALYGGLSLIAYSKTGARWVGEAANIAANAAGSTQYGGAMRPTSPTLLTLQWETGVAFTGGTANLWGR